MKVTCHYFIFMHLILQYIQIMILIVPKCDNYSLT